MGELSLGIGRRLRYGMVGGGPGAFIGAVHRRAVALDGAVELVAGVFSSDPKRSAEQGRSLLLDPERVYGSYIDMVEREAALPGDRRLDFVAIVAPNHLHFEVASLFLNAGFPIVCDKPMTTTLDDATALVAQVGASGLPLAVTYNYSGYPMVRQAREMVRSGQLGTIRKIVVEYSQGWLTQAIEADGQKQASWRTDPVRAGAALALGDIGTHAEHLVRYVTGLQIDEVFADLTTFVPGRQLEDDANLLFRCREGARGVMYASQVSVGDENHLVLKVYGTRASVRWKQENPNYLWYAIDGSPAQRLSRGNAYMGDAAQRATRLPPGHPEGFLEAFANVYNDFTTALAAKQAGDIAGVAPGYPTVRDGWLGVKFVHAALESHRVGTWVTVSTG